MRTAALRSARKILACISAAGLIGGCSDPGAPVAEPPVADPPAATAAVPLSPITYIKASNPGVDDQFGGSAVLLGVSMALSGDANTLVAGARFEDSAAAGINGDEADNSARNAGAAYVFARSPGGPWEQQAYLKASNTGSGDQFGFSVALSDDGNTLAVSANLEDSAATGINGDQDDNSVDNSGAVYLFARDNGAWSQQAYLKASNSGEPEDGDGFGYALSLSADGNLLAVGATGEDSAARGVDGDESDNSAGGAGAAYLFARNGTTWSQQAYLKASNAEETDLFGLSISLSDDGRTLAVSALDEDGSATGVNGPDNNEARGSGAIYVFTRERDQWVQDAYIKASNAAGNDAFSVVTLSGDGLTLAAAAFDEDSSSPGVGADQTDDSTEDTGAVYVFVRGAGQWQQQAYLKSANAGQYDQFGTRLSLSRNGNTLAVGSPLEDGSASGINGIADDAADEAGAVYLFNRTGEAWAQTSYVKAPSAEIYDEFGGNMALSDDGETLAVGVRVEDSGAAGIDGDQADNSVRDAGAVFVYH